MKPAYRRCIGVLALLCSTFSIAAPYPTETQLRRAIGTGAEILKKEGIETEAVDAQKEGLALSLLAAGLDLDTGTCLIFFNTRTAEVLQRFFLGQEEQDMPIWLDAMAVHEATHCIEQREAYLRQRFDKVLPPQVERANMTVQGYLSVVKSGAVETWGEALADIASLLYLRQAVPERWIAFGKGIAALRQDLARKSPEHDTSAWLHKLMAENSEGISGPDIFESAFRLRRLYQPN